MVSGAEAGRTDGGGALPMVTGVLSVGVVLVRCDERGDWIPPGRGGAQLGASSGSGAGCSGRGPGPAAGRAGEELVTRESVGCSDPRGGCRGRAVNHPAATAGGTPFSSATAMTIRTGGGSSRRSWPRWCGTAGWGCGTTHIQAGDDWRRDIDDGVRRAGAALLLVNGSYLDSRFIMEEELPALSRTGSGSCRCWRRTACGTTSRSWQR